MKYFVFFAVIFVIQNGIINACDFSTCSATKFHVCADETSFYRCEKSLPNLDTLYKCPAGLNCVNEDVRCSKEDPACVSKCDQCDAKFGVACISKHEFNFCLDNKPMPEMTGSCKEKFCDSGDADICSDKAQSCSKDPPPPPTLPPPTTTPKPTDPTPEEVTKKCIAANRVGKFMGTDCTKYIYCRPFGNTIIGQIYTCPGQTYFNCTTQQCGSKECKIDPTCTSIL